MNIYEIVKTYGKGKGEQQMWNSIKGLSEMLEESSMPKEEKCALKRKLYSDISGGHFNEEFAEEQYENMYYTDAVGLKHYAPYWTKDQIKAIYDASRAAIPADYTMWDFAVALNMLKSDYYCLLKDWFKGSDAETIDEKLISMTETYLSDEDAPHKSSKIWSYFN